MLVNDRRFFIHNFGRDAADDEAAENGDSERDAAEDEATGKRDFGKGAAEDEASEDKVDGATVNYDIPSPPTGQHHNNPEVSLQTIQEFIKEYGYALTTLRSKRKGGEVYKVYLHVIAENSLCSYSSRAEPAENERIKMP